MAEFLVEAYYSPDEPLSSGTRPRDVAEAADQLTNEGHPVRLVRAIFAPDDESCFYLFEADSDKDVSEAAARAGLRFQRLVEAVSVAAFASTADELSEESPE